MDDKLRQMEDEMNRYVIIINIHNAPNLFILQFHVIGSFMFVHYFLSCN